MRIARYLDGDEPKSGVVVDNVLHSLLGDPFGDFESGQPVGELPEVELLAPVTPSKVVCVGANYAKHIEEMSAATPERPLLFLKGPNTVVGPGHAVRRPEGVARFDYEGELAVVIGARATSVDRADWREVVLGFTCGNDVTARDWQEADLQWARAKGSDTFCPLGPWIETDVADPENLGLQTRVNGEVRQDGNTNDFIFGLDEVIAFITRSITLEPGDVILTGTPSGVGGMSAGDKVTVTIEGIGELTNVVVEPDV